MNKITMAAITTIIGCTVSGLSASATQAAAGKAEVSSSESTASLFETVSANGVEPIPGSLTYKGQPMTRLTKAPVGSSFMHEFSSGPTKYSENYVIQADRSLKLVSRNMKNQDR